MKRTSKKRTKIQAGDVIAISQSNGKQTLAYVLRLWPKIKSLMTIALVRKESVVSALNAGDVARLIDDQVTGRQLIAVLSTTTGTAEVGEWPKVTSVPDLDIEDLLPEVPFRTNSLVGGVHQSAPLVESLVEAYRGLVSWEEALPGRPGHLKSLLFVPPTAH